MLGPYHIPPAAESMSESDNAGVDEGFKCHDSSRR
jgi:hypothetical protein